MAAWGSASLPHSPSPTPPNLQIVPLLVSLSRHPKCWAPAEGSYFSQVLGARHSVWVSDAVTPLVSSLLWESDCWEVEWQTLGKR